MAWAIVREVVIGISAKDALVLKLVGVSTGSCGKEQSCR